MEAPTAFDSIFRAQSNIGSVDVEGERRSLMSTLKREDLIGADVVENENAKLMSLLSAREAVISALVAENALQRDRLRQEYASGSEVDLGSVVAALQNNNKQLKDFGSHLRMVTEKLLRARALVVDEFVPYLERSFVKGDAVRILSY